ncbi:MAG: PqqD family protein [Deltaproteobacteria bacterium]|nr:PqqD family protein [Deltaproteobacteria bacterium]
MPRSDDARFLQSAQVLSRILDGEAVLLDLEGGAYLGLNDVGTVVWGALGEGLTLAEACTRVTAAFEVDEATARRDVEALLDELLRRGLILAAATE